MLVDPPDDEAGCPSPGWADSLGGDGFLWGRHVSRATSLVMVVDEEASYITPEDERALLRGMPPSRNSSPAPRRLMYSYSGTYANKERGNHETGVDETMTASLNAQNWSHRLAGVFKVNW